MKSLLPKLLAAAAIIGVVLLVVVLRSAGVTPDDVLEQLEQMKTFRYEVQTTTTGVVSAPGGAPRKVDMTAVVAEGVGRRITAYNGARLTHETFVSADDQRIITIMPDQKRHIETKLTDDVIRKIQRESGDPRALIRRFAKNKCVALGRSMVSGVKVEGFECDDLNQVDGIFDKAGGRLWVDVKTKLPIQLDITFQGADGKSAKKMLVENFQWDVEVAPDLFEVEIPSESALLIDDVELLTEEKMYVEVLGLFAELTGGRYPSKVDVPTIEQEFREAMITNFGHPMTEALRSETIQKLMNLQTTGEFHTAMASQDADLGYYGDMVTADFPHAVLMRWKADDGMYKVIFGDLSVRKVASAKLQELEAMPLNLKRTAIKPHPADRADAGSAPTGLELTWMSGNNAVAHRVYYGTTPDELALLAEVATESAELPVLQRGRTYYWRVDEVGSDRSVATGPVWSFDTGRLVAHWKLDEGSGEIVANSVSDDYNGRLVGDAKWTNGIMGGALEFDGVSGYVEIVDSNDFVVINQITVCAWIKTDKIVRRWQSIITKGDRSWRLQGRRSGCALEFCCTGLIVPGNPWGSLYGNIDVNDGQWHHVAGVYDGERISLYVDGQVDNSENATGTIRLDSKQVRIGDNSQHPGRYWCGLIDDVRIYNYGMTAQEIAALASRERQSTKSPVL